MPRIACRTQQGYPLASCDRQHAPVVLEQNRRPDRNLVGEIGMVARRGHGLVDVGPAVLSHRADWLREGVRHEHAAQDASGHLNRVGAFRVQPAEIEISGT